MHRFLGCATLCLSVIAAGCSQTGASFLGTRDDGSTAIRPGSSFPGVSQSSFASVYSFKGPDATVPDGMFPHAGLTLVGTKLYGTTSYGGVNHAGTVFEVEPSTGVETVLHDFQHLYDAAEPYAGLTLVGNKLYGTTTKGGNNQCVLGCGTIFEISLSGVERVVYEFNGASGAEPLCDLTFVVNKLYGTTRVGGAANAGTIFEFDPFTGAEHVLHSFAPNVGASEPYAGLTFVGVKLYGTAHLGGASNLGSIFEYGAGTEQVVHFFTDPASGGRPRSGLTLLGGKLYGTTPVGGGGPNASFGTVFEVDPSTGTERLLHTFSGADGAIAEAGLTVAGGKLYGTTAYGGSHGAGTVFEVEPASGVERVVHSFNGTDGANPHAGLTLVGNTLYGTTVGGGTSNLGTVYEVTP